MRAPPTRSGSLCKHTPSGAVTEPPPPPPSSRECTHGVTEPPPPPLPSAVWRARPSRASSASARARGVEEATAADWCSSSPTVLPTHVDRCTGLPLLHKAVALFAAVLTRFPHVPAHRRHARPSIVDTPTHVDSSDYPCHAHPVITLPRSLGVVSRCLCRPSWHLFPGLRFAANRGLVGGSAAAEPWAPPALPRSSRRGRRGTQRSHPLVGKASAVPRRLGRQPRRRPHPPQRPTVTRTLRPRQRQWRWQTRTGCPSSLSPLSTTRVRCTRRVTGASATATTWQRAPSCASTAQRSAPATAKETGGHSSSCVGYVRGLPARGSWSLFWRSPVGPCVTRAWSVYTDMLSLLIDERMGVWLWICLVVMAWSRAFMLTPLHTSTPWNHDGISDGYRRRAVHVFCTYCGAQREA